MAPAVSAPRSPARRHSPTMETSSTGPSLTLAWKHGTWRKKNQLTISNPFKNHVPIRKPATLDPFPQVLRNHRLSPPSSLPQFTTAACTSTISIFNQAAPRYLTKQTHLPSGSPPPASHVRTINTEKPKEKPPQSKVSTLTSAIRFFFNRYEWKEKRRRHTKRSSKKKKSSRRECVSYGDFVPRCQW